MIATANREPVLSSAVAEAEGRTLECARNVKETAMDFRDTPDALRLSAAADTQDERR